MNKTTFLMTDLNETGTITICDGDMTKTESFTFLEPMLSVNVEAKTGVFFAFDVLTNVFMSLSAGSPARAIMVLLIRTDCREYRT